MAQVMIWSGREDLNLRPLAPQRPKTGFHVFHALRGPAFCYAWNGVKACDWQPKRQPVVVNGRLTSPLKPPRTLSPEDHFDV